LLNLVQNRTATLLDLDGKVVAILHQHREKITIRGLCLGCRS
jgi:hypothetical protein